MVRTWPPNYLLRGGVNKKTFHPSIALGAGQGGGGPEEPNYIINRGGAYILNRDGSLIIANPAARTS